MKKRVLLLSCVIASALSAGAQVSLTGSSPVYTQDFNTLATSGTTNVLSITGWALNETGSNANQQYRSGDGSTNNGDTYSFGTGTNTDRALGGVASGTLTPSFGVSFSNNTGNTITGVQINFKGEHWRRAQGVAGSLDSLLFSYSTNASSLSDGAATWITVPALHFTSVNTTAAGTAIALDGNSVSANVSSFISLNVASGSSFWFRWIDPNVVGNDDGLAIDDFQASFTTSGGGVPDTLVRFSPTSATKPENGGSQVLNLTYFPVSPVTAFSAQVVLKSGNAADIGNYTTQTANFAANSNTASITVNITDNAIVDGNKTFVFAIRNPSGAMLVGNDSLFTLTVTDNEAPVVGPPVYTIAQVRGANTNGGPDSLNVTCELRGTVYGVNLRPGGFEFTINDGTAGISVYAPVGANTFGYTVNEGDSIRIWGDVITFRGLAQMGFLDTVILAGPGNLQNPSFTNVLGESTESKLIRASNCTLTNPSQWTPGGSSFNVDCNCGGQPVKVRIHSATTAINAAAPTGMFDVIGIGSQFATSASAPFTDGYQLIPRRVEDILYGGSISENEASSNMSVFPNPTAGNFFVNFESSSTGKANVSLKDLTGRTVVSKNMNLVSGNNQFEINEKLSAGIYLVAIEINGTQAVKRVIVK